MTTHAQKRDPDAHLRAEVRQTQELAHAAIDNLDPTIAIAHCRALRSLLWRAEREEVNLSLRDEPTEVPK